MAYITITFTKDYTPLQDLLSFGNYIFKKSPLNPFMYVAIDEITHIVDYMFSHTSIEYIYIPEIVTYIGDYAFNGSKLTSIHLPDFVTYIGAYAFYYCTALKTVILPTKQITEISDYAFYHCHSLISIDLSNTIVKIGIGSFSCCVKLVKVNM